MNTKYTDLRDSINKAVFGDHYIRDMIIIFCATTALVFTLIWSMGAPKWAAMMFALYLAKGFAVNG